MRQTSCSTADALLILKDWVERGCSLMVGIDGGPFLCGISCIIGLHEESKTISFVLAESRAPIGKFCFDGVAVSFVDPLIGSTEEQRAEFRTIVKQALVFLPRPGLAISLNEPADNAPPLFSAGLPE